MEKGKPSSEGMYNKPQNRANGPYVALKNTGRNGQRIKKIMQDSAGGLAGQASPDTPGNS